MKMEKKIDDNSILLKEDKDLQKIGTSKICLQYFLPSICKMFCNFIFFTSILAGILVGIYYLGLLFILIVGFDAFKNSPGDNSFFAIYFTGFVSLIIIVLIIFLLYFGLYECLSKKWKESVEKVNEQERKNGQRSNEETISIDSQ
jgi:hypothetical protein